jgi:transposase InsO family protein
MDFVHDQLATGRKLRVLTIVDTFSRFSPATEVRFNFRGADVVEVLERVGRRTGLPATIRVDQGSEFVSRDLDLWAYQRDVTLDFSRPGNPTVITSPMGRLSRCGPHQRPRSGTSMPGRPSTPSGHLALGPNCFPRDSVFHLAMGDPTSRIHSQRFGRGLFCSLRCVTDDARGG